jgi:hypothetical protein
MADTKIVEVGGKEVEVTVSGNEADAEIQAPPAEAKLVTRVGSEVHVSDLSAVDIRTDPDTDNLFVAYFNNEDRHAESPQLGNSINRAAYDRNWYFDELNRP